jgi:hypothetical protein
MNMTESDNDTSCNAVLDKFKSRDFSGWQGLPVGCSIQAVLDYLGSNQSKSISGRLGQQATPYYTIHMEGYENPIRLWFRDEVLVLVEAEYPSIRNDLAALQEELGPPAARYGFNWQDLTLEDAQWVYAEKGITLVINPDNKILLYLTVYAPTSLDQYDQNYFLDRRTIRTQRR